MQTELIKIINGKKLILRSPQKEDIKELIQIP